MQQRSQLLNHRLIEHRTFTGVELVGAPVGGDEMLVTDSEERTAAAVRIREHEGLAPDGKIEGILDSEARDASRVQYSVALVVEFERVAAYLPLEVFNSPAGEHDVRPPELCNVRNARALASRCLPGMQRRDQGSAGQKRQSPHAAL